MDAKTVAVGGLVRHVGNDHNDWSFSGHHMVHHVSHVHRADGTMSLAAKRGSPLPVQYEGMVVDGSAAGALVALQPHRMRTERAESNRIHHWCCSGLLSAWLSTPRGTHTASCAVPWQS